MDWKKTDLEEKAFAMIMAFFIVIMAGLLIGLAILILVKAPIVFLIIVGVLIVSYPIARLIIKHDIL